jgi:hypothetical protein
MTARAQRELGLAFMYWGFLLCYASLLLMSCA